MVDGTSPTRAGRDRVVAFLDRVPTLVWIGAVALVAVGVIALFGGLDEAEATIDVGELEELAVGVASGGDPTDVAVLSVERTTVIPELYLEAEPGQELIVIEVDAENTWDRTTVGIRDSVLLELDGETVEADRVLVSSDLAAVAMLPPRVPTRITLIWPMPVGAIGEIATVLVTDGVFVPEPVLLDAPYWRDLGPRWAVEAPVSTAPHFPGDDRIDEHLTGDGDDL